LATNRYEKYSIERVRENPSDAMEEELAEAEAQQFVDQVLNRIGRGPNFRNRIITKLAETELREREKAQARRQEALANVLP
jgi:hypothetical protein